MRRWANGSGVRTGGGGRVTRLYLGWNELTGPIPEVWADCPTSYRWISITTS